jgi:hypothetical protein
MHRHSPSRIVRLFALAAFVAGGMPGIVSMPAAAQQADAVQTMPEPIRLDLSFKLPDGQPIRVDNAYGSIYIRFGGYEHQLDIRATIQQPQGAAEFAFQPGAKAGRFMVTPVLPEGASLAEGQRIDLVLYVPKGHAVTARTGFGVVESRGVKSDLDLTTVSGEIAVRGTDGTVQAQTDDGRIEVTLEDGARPGSMQRIASRTGIVAVNVSDKLDAEVRLSTSQQFATDYSLTVRHLDGQEPNKTALAVVGSPKPGKQKAELVLESLGGEVRLQRKGVFVDPEAVDPGKSADSK